MDLIVKLDQREERLRLGGTRADRWVRKSRTYREGRVCETIGCSTILSRYNPRTLCWQHEPVRDPRTSRGGRRSAEISVTDLTTLSA